MVVCANYLRVTSTMDPVMDTGRQQSSAVVRLADQLMRFVLVVKRGTARFGGPNREGIEYPLLTRRVSESTRRSGN